MAYIGASPSNGVRQKHTYTATASQTTFSGAGAEGVSLSYRDSNYVDVYVNGVKLGDADYTATSGTSIVFDPGLPVNDIVEVIVYDVFSVADTVSKADGGVFDGNVTMAGTLGVTGETTLSANLNLGDNDKVSFSSGKLQIYHDGTNAYLDETYANGTFLIRGVNIALQKYTGETMIQCVADDKVELNFNNVPKLATTSSGIDVTGTVSADAVTVDGTGTSNFTSTATSPVQINGTSIPTLTVRNSTTPVELQMRATTGEGLVRTSTNHPLTFAVNASEKMRIDNSGNVGIGVTSSLVGKFNTVGSDNSTQAVFSGSTGETARGLRIATGSTSYANNDIAILDAQYTPRGTLVFQTQSTERMRITYNGNVGIGTSSPNRMLSLENGDLQIHETGSSDPLLQFSVGNTQASPTQSFSLRIDNSDSDKFQLINGTSGEIPLTVDTSSNVGIGTSSPERPFHVFSSEIVQAFIETSGSSARLAFESSGSNTNAGNLIAVDANDMWIRTNNTERMRIRSTGKIGLGTPNADAELHIEPVSGGANASILLSNDGRTQYFRIQNNETNDALTFNANDTNERMRIDSSGRVGIGATALGANLNILGANSDTWAASATNGLALNGNTAVSTITSYLDTSSIRIGAGVTQKTGMIITGQSTGSGSTIQFRTGNSERMRIRATGNVGIGTSDPDSRLDVATGANGVIFRYDAASTFLQILPEDANGDISLRYRANSGSAPDLLFKNDGGTERMRITSAGAMTMGTSTSQTAVSGITLKNDVQSGYPTLLFLQNQPGTGGTMGADIQMGYASDYGSILRFYGNPFNTRPGGFQFRRVTGSGTSDLSMQIGTDGAVIMPDVYNDTTGSGANLNITSAGQLLRSTSSLRYKNTINDATHGLTELLTLRPVTYKGNNDGDTVFGGLIAEEVHDAGLTEFVQYNDDDEPDALAYGNMVSLCIKAIQELKAELDSAKARISALENAE